MDASYHHLSVVGEFADLVDMTLRWSVFEPLPHISFVALKNLDTLASPFWMSLLIGLITGLISVVLAVGILEYLVSKGQKALALGLVGIPLAARTPNGVGLACVGVFPRWKSGSVAGHFGSYWMCCLTS